MNSSFDEPPRRPLVLTGGPAVGKTVTGRALAEGRSRAPFVDVDDLRQFVVAGHEWLGSAGAVQRRLGAVNACSLGRGFLAAGFDVTIADVVTPETAAVYREELPGCLVVHLRVPLAEARRRATTRQVWLTDAEFTELHRIDAADPSPVDHSVDVAGYSLEEQVAAVGKLWAPTAESGPAWSLTGQACLPPLEQQPGSVVGGGQVDTARSRGQRDGPDLDEVAEVADGVAVPVVVLMCGVAGSGKTTYAQQLEADGYVRLSIDEQIWARFGRYGIDYAADRYAELSATAEDELRQRLVELIGEGRNVVVDFSFWQRSNRDRYKELVERAGGRWRLVHLQVAREVLRRRLAERSRRFDANAAFPVDEDTQARHRGGFETPCGEGEEVITVAG